MVHFVGAGPGAPDLITLRGKTYLEQADVIIYAGSLVNPQLLDYAKEGCQVYNSAKMTLEEVLEVMEQAEQAGKVTVRLHTGVPCIYGAIREQMDELDRMGISYDSCPGVSSFCGAAAALNLEYTLPDISQSVIITRKNSGTGKREHPVLCGPSGNDGDLFEYRYVGRAEPASDRGRLYGGYPGGHRLQGHLGG